MMLVWAWQQGEHWELAPMLLAAQLSALASLRINTYKSNVQGKDSPELLNC